MILFKNSQTELDFEKEISRTYRLSQSSYDQRGDIIERYGKDGAEEIGNSRTKARNFKFEFDLAFTDKAEYLERLSKLVRFFDIRYKPFYIINKKIQRRALISTPQIKDNSGRPNFLRIGQNELSFKLLDGSWEAESEESITLEELENNGVFRVTNEGDMISYPVVRVTARGNNRQFTLSNQTTGGVFTLSSAAFGPGAVIEINNQSGVVLLDNSVTKQDITNSIHDNTGFLSLLPGENTFKYESVTASVGLKMTFRDRFAF